MSPSNQERNPLFCNRKDSLQLSIQLFPFHLQQHFNINQIRSVYIIDYAEFGAKYLIPRACPTLHQTFLKYKFWCQITLLVLEHLQPFAKSGHQKHLWWNGGQILSSSFPSNSYGCTKSMEQANFSISSDQTNTKAIIKSSDTQKQMKLLT